MTKLPDASPPELMKLFVVGTLIRSAEVQLYTRDGTVAETFDYQGVQLVTLATTNTGAATRQLFEQLGLKFTKITSKVVTGSGSTSSTGWDLSGNKLS